MFCHVAAASRKRVRFFFTTKRKIHSSGREKKSKAIFPMVETVVVVWAKLLASSLVASGSSQSNMFLVRLSKSVSFKKKEKKITSLKNISFYRRVVVTGKLGKISTFLSLFEELEKTKNKRE